MGKIWVRATGVCHYEESGIQRAARPGDWFEAGKHDARLWLAQGKVEIPKVETMAAVQNLVGCGATLRGEGAETAVSALKTRHPGLDVVVGSLDLAHPRNLLWDVSANLRMELALVGFGLLGKWQVAVPLCDYDLLARDVGGEEDRERTRELLHDLRVPLYDARVVFARRCAASRDLLTAWEEEGAAGGDWRLAFLRALHRVKPLVNALPPFWIR